MGIVTDVQQTGAMQRRIDNIVRRALKTSEETGELAEAVLSATSLSGGKGKHWMDIIEEAVDVVIMGLDIALTKPPEWQDIDDEMWRAIVKKIVETKLAKWKHQVRANATLIDEKLPKFTDEEHAEFMALLEPKPVEPTPRDYVDSEIERGMQLDREIDAGLHK